VSPTPSPAPSNVSPTIATASVPRAACGSTGARRTIAFRVAVDATLATTRVAFARALRRVLCDERSWIASRAVRFRYDPNGAVLYGLRTPDNTETRCRQLIGLSVHRTYSCATHREVVLNSARWFGGSAKWPGPLTEYRRMLVDHETGHVLGLRHQDCPREGAKAPVMMQQSKGLTSSNGKTCLINPWPLPRELARL